MVRKILAGIIIGIVVGALCIKIWHQQRSYIVIEGEVVYDEFEKGDIEVLWSKKLQHGNPAAQGIVYLNRPGRYTLKIPKNSGPIYLLSRNRGDTPQKRYSFAYFISDPIVIGEENISHYTIPLRANRLVMERYSGPTVTISGQVYDAQFTGGRVEVGVYEVERYHKVRLPPDIANIVLSAPGPYTISVPQGVGDVCLMAVTVPPGASSGNDPRCRRVSYKDNPLHIGDSDLTDIDMIIE
ncbi:MAG: hypothetical protein JXD21_00590 [Candidatus Omnitrophica bacterium]|nr:hypothetical protein [Candidatus Omnitrophota bacterium]